MFEARIAGIIKQAMRIEEITDSDLLVYYGEIDNDVIYPRKAEGISDEDYGKIKTQHKAAVTLNGFDIEQILTSILSRTTKRQKLNILIQTCGGSMLEAIRLVKRLRGIYEEFNVIVLSSAASVGTFIGLCGRTLYMRDIAVLSDFGPDNWINIKEVQSQEEFKEKVLRLRKVYDLYFEHLSEGVLKGQNPEIINKIVNEYGDACIEGIRSNGKPHGSTKIEFNEIVKKIPHNIKDYHVVPAPNSQMLQVADNLRELHFELTYLMKKHDLAKIIQTSNLVTTTNLIK